jgi:hypothetical protein
MIMEYILKLVEIMTIVADVEFGKKNIKMGKTRRKLKSNDYTKSN